jgi:hypothetical protein
MPKARYLILLMILSVSFAAEASAPRCYQLFNVRLNLSREPVRERQSERMLAPTRVDPNNTTSKRAEDKATLSQSVFNSIFSRFRTRMQAQVPGFNITLRDALRPGMNNVTWTRYTNSFELHLSGGRVTTGVVRLRKYGWVPEHLEVRRENIEVNPAFESISQLEFKIRDPDFVSDQFKSVLKPIIKINDRDAEALLSRALSPAEHSAVLSRTLQLNSDPDPNKNRTNHTIVTQMLQALRGLHLENNRLQMSYESLYKRSAYRIDVTDPANGQKRDIQITVDEMISTYVNEAQSFSRIYQTETPLVVVETKVPVSFIPDITDPARSSMPEMARGIADFIAELRSRALRDFEIGKGKLGHTIREFSDN